jgi:hypothetical protein
VLAGAARAIADAYLSASAALAEIEVNPLRVVVGEAGTTCSALDIVALRRLPVLAPRVGPGTGQGYPSQ